MRGPDWIFSGGRAEAGVSMLNLAASSVYWLALAFVLPPAAYGEMMTLQASVLIVVTVFTLRTHDLFFNLIMQKQVSVGAAYRRTLKVELVAASIAALLCSAGALIVYSSALGASTAIGVAIYAVLASFGVIHGASIGKLRYRTRGDVIVRTDLLSAVTWGVACLSIPLVGHLSIVTPLIIGAVPHVVRTTALIASARSLALKSEAGSEPASLKVGRAPIVGFLAEAQVANFLKNASVPVETLILAAFTPPATVAMYRIARATQGPATAALNVLFQRVFPELVQARSTAERHTALRRLRRNSLAVCLTIFPPSALIALGYSLLNPEIGIIELQLITAGTFVALLPGAFQQGAFAALSIAGDHRSIGIAYICSFIVLGLASSLLFAWPEVEVFMLGVIGSAVVRFLYMDARSRRATSMPPPAAANTGQ